jgi:hypothetical protein
LGHPDIPFSQVVGEWNREIVHERQDLLREFFTSVEQVYCFRLFLLATFSSGIRMHLDRNLTQSRFQDAEISVLKLRYLRKAPENPNISAPHQPHFNLKNLSMQVITPGLLIILGDPLTRQAGARCREHDDSDTESGRNLKALRVYLCIYQHTGRETAHLTEILPG